MKKIMFNDRFGLTQAVLNGRKTMTRRIIPNIPFFAYKENDVKKYGVIEDMEIRCGDTMMLKFRGDWYTAPRECQPKYKIGEVVAVAQSYELMANGGYLDKMMETSSSFKKEYCGAGYGNKMFVRADLMPHQIRIADIKVERLQDISDEDCLKEGIHECIEVDDCKRGYSFNVGMLHSSPREAFAELIDKISGIGTFYNNPYVFAYSFKLIK